MRELILGDALEILVDHRGKTPKKLRADYVERGVPVASAVMVENGLLDLTGARCINAETYARWMPEKLRQGDVLLTSEAPLGRVAQVVQDQPLALGQRLFGLRGRKGVLDNSFLFYALQSSPVQAELTGRSTGTTVVGIRQSALRDVAIMAPSFAVQRAIAEVLGAFDDKIAVNTRATATIEQLSEAMVSKVTERVALSTVATAARNPVGPADFPEQNVWHYSLPAFDDGKQPVFDLARSIGSAKFVLEQPSVLVSKLNPRIPRVWDVPLLRPGCSVTSTEFVVLTTDICTTSVLRAALAQPCFRLALAAKVSGTSGSHQRVRPNDLLTTEVTDPRAIPDVMAARVTSMGRLSVQLGNESVELTQLRDFLLPHLMSGRLRVQDVEKQVEEVV